MTEIDIVLFIARLLRRVRCENKPLPDLFDLPVIFLIQPECRADPVRFIQMIQIGFEAEFINQLRTSYPSKMNCATFVATFASYSRCVIVWET